MTICHIHSQGNIAPILLDLKGKFGNQSLTFGNPIIQIASNPKFVFKDMQTETMKWKGWKEVTLENPIIDYTIPMVIRQDVGKDGKYAKYWSVDHPHDAKDDLREDKAFVTYSNNFTTTLQWLHYINCSYKHLTTRTEPVVFPTGEAEIF